jgi:hypothetical protein
MLTLPLDGFPEVTQPIPLVFGTPNLPITRSLVVEPMHPFAGRDVTTAGLLLPLLPGHQTLHLGGGLPRTHEATLMPLEKRARTVVPVV